MKIKVEYSESIQIAEGLWRKCGIEIEDGDDENGQVIDREKFAQRIHTEAKEYVQRWHKEALGPFNPPIRVAYSEPVITSEIQVDRPLSNTIEALIKDIQSCKDITIIDSYRILVKTKPELQEAFEKRRAELVRLESKAIIAAADAYVKQ